MAPHKTDKQQFLSLISPHFLKFLEDTGRFPTQEECKLHSATRLKYNLIDYRTICRHFGGVVAFRTHLGIADTDMRKTPDRVLSARKGSVRHTEEVINLNAVLEAKYGRVNVHREESYSDNERSRTDFRVFGRDGNTAFIIDVLVPTTNASQAGCIRSKIKKIFDVGHYLDAPVLLVDAGVGKDKPFHLVQPIDAEFFAPIYTVGMDAFLAAVGDESLFPFPML